MTASGVPSECKAITIGRPQLQLKEDNMDKINNIKILKEKTGCSYSVANKILNLCKDVKIALEFLKLRGQAIVRYRTR